MHGGLRTIRGGVRAQIRALVRPGHIVAIPPLAPLGKQPWKVRTARAHLGRANELEWARMGSSAPRTAGDLTAAAEI